MRFILLALFLFVPLVGFAQVIPTLESPLEISVIPNNPQPGSRVSFVAQNVPTSGEVLYVWKVDGATYDQGVAKKQIQITLGNAGDNTSVSLAVYVNGTLYGEKERFVRPAGITLIYEGKTTRPPFSNTFPLVNRESTVQLLAIPNVIHDGVRVPSGNLMFEWSINNSRKIYRSGVGLDAITLTPPGFGENFSVHVTAKTFDGLVESSEAVSISPSDPELFVYEKTPLLGVMLNKLVGGSYALKGEESTFVAYPTYTSKTGSLAITWRVNGSIEETPIPNEITFRRESSGSGRYNVSIAMQGVQKLFENASKNFLLTF